MNRDHCAPCLGAMGKTTCVFLMEKDHELCEVLEALLRLMGFEVMTFPTPQALLESFREYSPLCLILDLYSPPENRYRLVEEVVSLSPQVPILFMTLENPTRYLDHFQKYKQISFVRKPFTSEAFRSALETISLKEAEEARPWPVRRPEEA